METVEDLLRPKPVAEKIKDQLQQLADLTGGRLALVNARGQIALETEAAALNSLAQLNQSIEEKLAAEWVELGQALTSHSQPFFVESDLGLIIFWMPIRENGQLLGGLLGYGGFFDDRQGSAQRDQQREDLYYRLDLAGARVTWEDYREAIAGMKFIRPQYLEERAAFLASVISALMTENLIQNVQH